MLHQKHPRLKIVETQRTLKDLAIKYPGMCRLGEEKTWAQNMMERFNVVLAHLRRVQDGTRWIQCTRSMGDPEIQLLKEMVDMIPPEDDFQNVKKPPKPSKSQSFPLLILKYLMNLKYLMTLKKNLIVAFHQGPPSTSLVQILVTQLVKKYHWFLPPRTRSRRNGL